MKVLSIDVETTKKPNFLPWMVGSYIVSLSITRSDFTQKSWLFNHPEATQTIRECVEEIQAEIDAVDLLVSHNIKFDLHWLMHIGIDFTNCKLYCTLVAEYILSAHQRLDGLSMNDLATRYELPLKKDKVKIYWDAGHETDQIPASILNEYCEYDTKLALSIYFEQQVRIRSQELQRLIALDMECIRSYQEMEWNGMLLNDTLLNELADEATARLAEMDAKLTRILGISNISSGDQLSCGLFGGTYKVDGRVPGKREGTMKNGKVDVHCNGAGFTPIKGTETKKAGIYQTNVDTLLQLKAKTKIQKEIVEILQERSRLDQLNKTYFKGLVQRMNEEHLVRPSVNQTLTKTSRLSCSNPNLQNQPRGNTGPVKQCFITRF